MRSNNVTRHMKMHLKYSPKGVSEKEAKTITWHSCAFCHYKSDSRYNLKLHMQNCLSFVNDQCSQEAGTQTTSSSKKEEDHGIECKKERVNLEEMLYLCDECGEHFSKTQDFEHHLIQKHASTLQCEHCNASLKSRKSLLRHVREQHGAERFSCLHCNYKTNRKYQLNEHKKTHNVKPSTPSKHPRQKSNNLLEPETHQDSNKLLEPETHQDSMLIADNMLVEPEEMEEVQRSQDEKEMFEDSLTVLKIYKLLKRMSNR